MFIKQVSAFLENNRGTLAKLTKLLADRGIDLIALSIADTSDFGILRAIVTDGEGAAALLRDAGYTVSLTEVLAVSVEDKPGGLARVLKVLDENGISVEYLYSFVRQSGGHALIIFRVEECERAHRLLTEAGIHILNQQEVLAL